MARTMITKRVDLWHREHYRVMTDFVRWRDLCMKDADQFIKDILSLGRGGRHFCWKASDIVLEEYMRDGPL